jgi:histone deacetylase 1/2
MSASAAAEEPTSVDQALADDRWVAAMDLEYQDLLKNPTWRLVPKPKGKNVIGSRWVYKVKRKADGTN